MENSGDRNVAQLPTCSFRLYSFHHIKVKTKHIILFCHYLTFVLYQFPFLLLKHRERHCQVVYCFFLLEFLDFVHWDKFIPPPRSCSSSCISNHSPPHFLCCSEPFTHTTRSHHHFVRRSWTQRKHALMSCKLQTSWLHPCQILSSSGQPRVDLHLCAHSDSWWISCFWIGPTFVFLLSQLMSLLV